MATGVISKDIIFAFFGLFLSIVFTQGLFGKILTFVYEFSYSVIPFGYTRKTLQEDEKYTKNLAADLNAFEAKRARNLQKIHKSISCNAAIGMTILSAAISAAAFKVTGLGITNFAIMWGIFLTLLFVYSSYYGWVFLKNGSFWSDLPPMSSSKYNILLTIEAATLVFYFTLLARGAFSYWSFYIFALCFVFLATRIHRIPHINATHERAKKFSDNEAYYLQDIGKETLLIAAILICCSFLQFNFFDQISNSPLGQYIEIHPVRTFLVLFIMPFLVFFVTFFRCVGWRSILSFLTHIKKQPLET